MLTIVGYSINATIVIFDRVRENLGTMQKKDSLEELVNRSISQTLTRSIFTSLTTFIMVAALYILGVTSIREFALPLMVGIVCGTYSSVCITGALWYVLRTKIQKKEVVASKSGKKKK
jgi:SecD/SecF fusion protein